MNKALATPRNIAKYIALYSITEPNSGCSLWTRSTDSYGYGQLWIGRKSHQVHRMRWSLAKGKIPKGKFVLHRCDVPACNRLKHLFLGTKKDNMRDCVAKGRTFMPKGELHGEAKLTAHKVLKIRADLRSQRAIAKKYGVSQRLIWNIKNDLAWKHLVI
jgi:hypothetical protein